jgi:acyl-CoA dehydrogenase
MVENLVAVATEATQIMGGKSIMQGPKNPLIEKILQWAQIARTVEGARNLGHGMIIPGQGMVRVHPQILDEIAASQKESKREAAGALWEIMMGKHLPNLLNNLDEARSRGKNNGEGTPAVTKDPNLVKYYEQYNRLSSAFNVVANVALVTVGGALKFKEALGSHLGDVLIHAYAVGTALEDYERRGCPEAERPMLELGCEMYLEKMEEGMHEFIRNYRDQMPEMIGILEKTMLPNMNKMLESKIKNKTVANFLGNTIGGLIKKVFNYMPEFLTREVFPEGRTIGKPLDSLKLKVGNVLLNPGPARDYLIGGIYIPGAEEPENPIHQLEEAFHAKTAVRPLAAKVGRAIRKGEIANPYEAVTKGILTQEEGEQLLAAQKAAEKAVMVDDYPAEMFRPAPAAPTPVPPA